MLSEWPIMIMGPENVLPEGHFAKKFPLHWSSSRLYFIWKIFLQKFSKSNIFTCSVSHFGHSFSVLLQYTNEITLFFKKVHFFTFLTLKPHSDHIFEIGQEIFHIHEVQACLSDCAKPWHEMMITLGFMSSWKMAKMSFRKDILLWKI